MFPTIPGFGNSADRVTHKKPSNILEKTPLLISLFFYYCLQIKFVSFLKVWPATIPCKRKTIKWATTLDIKKKGKGKKERSSARKNKKLLHYILLVGKYVLVVAKLIFGHFNANWPKTSPRKRNWWTMRVFLATLWHSPKGWLICPWIAGNNPFLSMSPRSRTTNLKLHFVEWTLFCF